MSENGKSKNFYSRLRQKQLEVSLVPPQRFGIFTPLYKTLVPYVKVAPWKIIIPAIFLAVVFIRFFLGSSFVRLVSVLQKGF